MATANLTSILLASTDPARLRDFYVKTLRPKLTQTPDGGYDLLDFGGFYVFVDSRDDVGETNPEPGRVIFNIEVDDAQGVADRMEEAGAQWLAKLEDRDGSLFATAIDPDGNYVQLIQLSERHKAEMAANT